MISKVAELKLDRPARKQGGDRYQELDGKSEIVGQVYIDQKISRAEGAPKERLWIMISDGPIIS